MIYTPEPPPDISLFCHSILERVKFHEVDMLGVCNNAVYINYFEDGRLAYIKDANLLPEGGIFADGELFFIVRNEINYRSHSRFDDELRIYTRVSYVKNSSYGFEHLVVNTADNSIIADGKGAIVHVDQKTGRSSPLPAHFFERIPQFDPHALILADSRKGG